MGHRCRSRRGNDSALSPPRNNNGTVERALHAITGTLQQSLFAEEIAAKAGLFQSLDARAKLLSVFLLLIAVGLSHSLIVIGLIYVLALALGWASAIPLDSLVRRVWLALPFFTGLIALPAVFLTPGPALVNLPLGLVITRTGAVTALFLLLRVSTSLSLTLLLVLTTPWNMVLNALSVLHVPDVFVLMLGMTYRYIYLLLRVSSDMFLSRRSRLVGRLSLADSQQIMGSITGTLLGKSLDLSSEVYLAMQSRGFRGAMVGLKPFHMQRKDWFWAAVLWGVAGVSMIAGR